MTMSDDEDDDEDNAKDTGDGADEGGEVTKAPKKESVSSSREWQVLYIQMEVRRNPRAVSECVCVCECVFLACARCVCCAGCLSTHVLSVR